jgi:predicted NAD/FAD-binding protein
MLPRNRRAWACWNYFRPSEPSAKATVTYNMNMLQSLESERTFCVTLNDNGRIHPENVIQTFRYSHPIFGINRKRMQLRHHELIGHKQTSFCGAYWGNGFHEDGVKSGLAVAETLSGSRIGASIS